MAKSLSVFNMVIRDSAHDFVLVTVWGSEMFVDELIDTIAINSAGNLIILVNLEIIYLELFFVVYF